MDKENNKILQSGGLPDKSETTLFEMSARYMQEGDTLGDDEINELEIKTQDGGGGNYYCMSTDRFTFDKPEELMEILNDFVSRFSPSK